MKFDDFLNAIFRKGGLLFIILVVIMTMALSGCLLTEALACVCYPCGYICGCDNMCAEVCWACGEECDSTLHDEFELSCPDGCALADCLFDDGCLYESESCSIGCGGLGTGFYSKHCRGESYPTHNDGCECSVGYCEAGCEECYFRCGNENCD